MRDLRDDGDLGQAGRSDRERERRCERLPDALAAGGPGRPGPLGDGPAPGRARALRPSHRGRRHVGAGLGEPGEDPREAGPFRGSRGLSLEGRGPEPGERRRVSARGPGHPSFHRRCVGSPRSLAAAGRNRGAEGRRHASRRGARPLRLPAPRGPFLDCGLTTGAVNGLTFGKGATNGLVNGNGFTNGRRGRYGPPRIPAQPHWSRSVVGIAAVVALMVIVPILASMLSPSPGGPSSIIRIDGDFSDWAPFPAYADSSTDQVQNPGINLLDVKVATQNQNLFVNARVQGLLFQGSGSNETDSVFVFLDEDNNRNTGYPIGDLGADAMVEIYGWRDSGRWRPTGAVARAWRSFGSR